MDVTSQFLNHRLRGSGSTVVTMTSKVNGTTQISTPCRSETPESTFGTVVGMDSPQRAVTSFFTVSKIQDGGRPPFWKKENRHNSAAIADILAKFGVLVAVVSPQHAVMLYWGYTKIQDGGRPPFWKKENLHNSAGIWDIFTKFGVLVAVDGPQRPWCHFWATTKSNPRWRPENFKWPCLCSGSSNPLHVWF